MKKPANKFYHYSLLDRLTKGSALPRSELSPFQLAKNQVFGNRVLRHAVNKAKDLDKASGSDTLMNAHKALPFMKGMNAQSNLLNDFIRIGRWNPLAWLEVLALSWLNTATVQHAPSNHSFFKNIVTGLNIFAAYTFNTVAKTLNLVGTPIAIAALGVFALAMGLTTGILVLSGAAVLMLGVAIYSAYIYAESREPDATVTGPDVVGFFKEAAWSIVLGIFTPVIRAFENLKNLYDKHPTIAVAAGIVGVAAVLFLAVFPHVGIGALLGFKLGAMIIAPIVNALTVPAAGSLGVAILTKTALVAFSIGIMDACVRGFKEIADSINPAMPVEDAADRVFISSCDSDSAPHSFDNEDFNKVVYEGGSPPVLHSGGPRAARANSGIPDNSKTPAKPTPQPVKNVKSDVF